jgi:ABC-type branched-subunit amino acid transport system permease subunit
MIFLGAILVVLVLLFPKGVLGSALDLAGRTRRGRNP